MKPFDLEAVKRGEKFVHARFPSIPATFVGFRKNGSVVYETDREDITWARAEDLCMLPVKQVLFTTKNNVQYVFSGGGHRTLEQAQQCSDCRQPTKGPIVRLEWEE